MNIVNIAKSAIGQVKIDQEGLDLLRVNLCKDSERSRAVLRVTSEIGIDLPGDQLEHLLVLGVNAVLPQTQE